MRPFRSGLVAPAPGAMATVASATSAAVMRTPARRLVRIIGVLQYSCEGLGSMRVPARQRCSGSDRDITRRC